ncbi:DUF397 domain-containing protein [Nocardiopsis valliformis]|uniref:DUF397 domain-containing protein n=1 Tax=Nocardiopsis valliformis TaxID=239974 RepID=UPI000349EDC0|nr:DUF397 domain-containing protein [Nocardiopsis valliformis]
MNQQWHKSSYSGATNNCVEARETPAAVDLRDTQNRNLGHLTFPGAEWTALLTTACTDRA